MYLLFREKNIMPAQSYWMGKGEKKIAYAFIKRELHEKNEEAKRIRRKK